ncbi:MAG TPA: hypothetical protein ENI27_04370 [bacterium]|nr:hypothetical protein [bacterium]
MFCGDTAFRIRANIEVRQAFNRPIRGFRLFGGGSKSALRAQIIVDVTGIPVTTLYTADASRVADAGGIGGNRRSKDGLWMAQSMAVFTRVDLSSTTGHS